MSRDFSIGFISFALRPDSIRSAPSAEKVQLALSSLQTLTQPILSFVHWNSSSMKFVSVGLNDSSLGSLVYFFFFQTDRSGILICDKSLPHFKRTSISSQQLLFDGCSVHPFLFSIWNYVGTLAEEGGVGVPITI